MQHKYRFSRTDILAVILLGCMAIFVMRLFWLQIIQHGTYAEIAKRGQWRNFVIPASRGEIYMQDGSVPVPVVLNQTVYNVIADPASVKESDRSSIAEAIQDVAGGEMVKDIKNRLSNEKSRYEVLAKNINRTQAEKLKKLNFSGVGFQRSSIRNYPEGQLGAQVLGFVNSDGEGQYGIEQQLNEELKGRDGMLQSVADVQNVPLTLGKDNIRIEPKSGSNLILSIDRNIQSYAEEALKRGIDKAGATEGSVLVLNPNNGQVLAMANYPTFNPGEYYNATDAAVFTNTTTMLPYEPASVIKTFTLSAAIDKGKVAAGTSFQNSDCIQVADRRMCNTLKGLGGPTTMQQVLNNSLNVGTIYAARQLGDGSSINYGAREIMYDYFHNKFGLGEKTGIEVGEAGGYIYPPDSQEGNEVRYSAMTYGQSLSLTMIQVAAGFCSAINGGEYYRPTLIAGTMDRDTPTYNQEKPLRRTVSESTSSEMRNMLITARNSSWIGKTDKPGYAIGGKTGTAETVNSSGEYTQSETVATYIGFGGVDKPEYVIMVRVAAPGKGLNLEGGLHAGPVFSDISNWMIDYKMIVPKE